MRNDFDFSPLFRSSVGFDGLVDLLRGAARVEHLENYPPYNIERTLEDAYCVTLAVAGFRDEELTITQQQNMLVVSGERRETDAAGQNGSGSREVLHRGIAARAFERRFNLADYVKVTRAQLRDGLLTIELRREVPEAMRPRRIEITAGTTARSPQRQIEGDAVGNRKAA